MFASVWLLAASAAAVADWSRIEVDGFTFTGDVDERRLKAIASDLRLFRYAIGRYITTVPSGDVMPIRVFAVAEKTWDDYLRPREGLSGMFVPGAFDGEILIDADHGWDRARIIVYHEYTHHYIHNLNKFPFPVWFHEGLAQFLSTTVRDGRNLMLGRMPYGNWLKTDGEAWIPLSRLVMVDQDSPEYVEHDGESQFYLQAWLLMHYILVGDRSLQDGLNVFLAGTVSGGDPAALAVKAFGRTTAALDEELKAYYRKQRFQVLPIPAPAKLEKVKEKARPMPEQDALRAMGVAALRSRPQDPNRIAQVFSKLLEIDSGDTTAMAGLAMARTNDEADDADRWIAAVEAASRTDAVALRLCGDYHIERARRDFDPDSAPAEISKARQCYQRALAADPQDYYALIGVVQSSQDLSPVESKALAEPLEAALRRYPQSEHLAFALAAMYHNMGDDARAVAMIRRAAGASRDPDMRQQLAALLKQLVR